MPTSPARNTAEELTLPGTDMLPFGTVTGGEGSSPTSLQNQFSQGRSSITSRIHTGNCSARKIQTELWIAGMDRRKKL